MKRIVYLPDPTILFYINTSSLYPNEYHYYSSSDEGLEVLNLKSLESPRDLVKDLLNIKCNLINENYRHPYFKDLYDKIELFDIIEV